MIPASFRFFLRLLLPFILLTGSAYAVPPTAPVVSSVVWTSANVFTINWQDKSSDETGFVIAYRTGPTSNYDILIERPANTTTHSLVLDASFRVCGIILEWTVASFKGTGAAREYSVINNGIETLPPPPVGQASCPPMFRNVNYYSTLLGTPFTFQATAVKRNTTNGALIPIASTYTATGGTGLPPGLNINSAGLISGTPTALGKYNVTLNVQEAGGQLVTMPLKLTTFKPVPALVAPVNGTPLTDRTLRRNAAATVVDLSTHFNDPDVTDATRVTFNTGTMDFLYYPESAPATVTNFKGYISRGDFVNTIIHRSIPAFVLQGGGYKAEIKTPSITRQAAVVNEPVITNGRGTVAMAKSGGSPNSATSEFFVSLADNSSNLNNQNEGFTVFARVPASGMAVADAIANLPIRNYSADTTNGNPVLTDCPVLNPPPASFNVASLVKMISTASVAPLSYTAQSATPAVCGVSITGNQLSLNPITTGTAAITVTATDLDNQPLIRTFNVTVEERLSDWLTAQNFPNGADATAAADPDGDSGTNLMEFGLMTDPKSATPVPVPLANTALMGADTFLTLSFPVRKLAGPGFVYAVESHNALTGTWTQIWKSTDGFAHALVASASDQPDRTNVTIRDATAITAGTIHYLRLRVTDTP